MLARGSSVDLKSREIDRDGARVGEPSNLMLIVHYVMESSQRCHVISVVNKELREF